ncbi:HNH endonuclease [Streptomyces sp. NPDC058625]|uniref:HNH endonuclease n=1 Tax=Streptomyces sp. NPDC058625 TaxID=3346564 RepID=UPI00364EF80E
MPRTDDWKSKLTQDPKELNRREQEELCLACAEPLPEDRSGKRTFCNVTCYRRHDRAAIRAREGEQAKPDARTCSQCGGSMEGRRKSAKHCGERCKDRARRQRERDAKAAAGKVCVRCGGRYPASRLSKHCEDCATAVSVERAEVRVEVAAKRCPKCGIAKAAEEFQKNRANRDGLQSRCHPCQNGEQSKSHAKYREERNAKRRAYGRTTQGREIQWAENVEHRVRLAGAEVVERVERRKVFERDGWTCQLCGSAVLRETGQHPDSATVDHIKPTVDGGEHSYANTHTAHRRCNRSKWGQSVAELIAADIEKRGAVSLPVLRLALMFPEEAYAGVEQDGEVA